MSVPKIVSDAEMAAQWISTALKTSGYKADFSLQSLQEIERFFVEHTDGAGRSREDCWRETPAQGSSLWARTLEALSYKRAGENGSRQMAMRALRSISPSASRPALRYGPWSV
jgi:hypothetical protein